MAYTYALTPAYSLVLSGLGEALRSELVAPEPGPQRLTELLKQLEARVQADITRDRWYAAVDHAVGRMVDHQRNGAKTQEP